MACCRTFAARRRVVLAWVWWDTSPTKALFSNAWFQVKHPVLTWQVNRLVRLRLAGREHITVKHSIGQNERIAARK